MNKNKGGIFISIQNVTLYGAGLIGSGWATHLMCCDFPNVTLYDIREEALDQARRRIQHDLEFLVGESVLKEEQALERMGRLRFTCDQREALADADLIQENCPENLELKQTVVAAIEMSCRPDTIIASSTSGISATLIAKNMNHPERLMGAHPYHPVYLLPLVELVKGEKTNPLAMEMAACIIQNARAELKETYPNALYEGETTDTQNQSAYPKEFPEPLTAELLEKHQAFSESCKP